MIVPSTRLERILPLLRCIACASELEYGSVELHCAHCEARYPLAAGRPVFVRESPRIFPEQHISNSLTEEVIDFITWANGWVLNIGAGGSKHRPDNCIELEYNVFRNTDVAADAHELPFADAAFEAVVTFNTFEHLSDPERAAAEIMRVLKPGGRLILRTAFMQPVHEPPYHFYNTTEYGLRRWFRNFEIRSVEVTDNFNPAHVFAWLASEVSRELANHLGDDAYRKFLTSPMSFWQEAWDTGTMRDHPLWANLGRLPQQVQSRFSAGFHLEAVKPIRVDGEFEHRSILCTRAERTHKLLRRQPASPAREHGAAQAKSATVVHRIPSSHKFRVAYVLKPGIADAAVMRYRAYNLIECLELAGFEAAHFDETQLADRLEEILNYDLIVLIRRPWNERIGSLLDAADAAGVPVVIDFDDYLFDDEIAPNLAAAARINPSDALKSEIEPRRRVFDRCAYFTGSIDYLTQRATDLGKTAYTIANGVNRAQIRASEQAFERRQSEAFCLDVTLGYFSGTRTHQRDFQVIAHVLVDLMRELPQLRLLVCGDFDLVEFSQFAPFSDRIDTPPFVDWRVLPDLIAKCDINLAPLELNCFTHGKSELKYYEAALLGIPTVASPIFSMKNAIRSGDTGFLADTDDEWRKALLRLITDRQFRTNMGERARQHALTKYSPEVIGRQAIDVYRAILADHRRNSGVAVNALTITILFSDTAAAIDSHSPALSLAREMHELGAVVTIQAATNSLTNSQLYAALTTRLASEIPCCDVLLAGDTLSLPLLQRMSHRARQTACLLTDDASLTADALTNVRCFAFDKDLANALKTLRGVDVSVLPSWTESLGEPRSSGTFQPRAILVTVHGAVAPEVSAACKSALAKIHARYPEIRVWCPATVIDFAPFAQAIPAENGEGTLESVFAENPICVAIGSCGLPPYLGGLLARGYPVITPLSDRWRRVVGEPAPGTVPVSADSVTLAAAIESFLVNHVRLTRLAQEARANRESSTPRQAALALLDALELSFQTNMQLLKSA